MSSAAYIIIKQNQYMKTFRKAGAVDPARAKPLAELGLRHSHIFQKMVDKEIFRPGRSPESFYIDERAAEEFVEARRRRAFYMFLLILIVLAVMFFFARR
jgi:hypothetical protein